MVRQREIVYPAPAPYKPYVPSKPAKRYTAGPGHRKWKMQRSREWGGGSWRYRDKDTGVEEELTAEDEALVRMMEVVEGDRDMRIEQDITHLVPYEAPLPLPQHETIDGAIVNDVAARMKRKDYPGATWIEQDMPTDKWQTLE